MTPWADMLSRIGQKNSLLFDAISREFAQTHESEQYGKATRELVVEELERERSRIARELHAGAGQPLAGIKLNLEMLDVLAAGIPPSGREALARLQVLATQALDQVRAISHKLHPPDWQGLTVEEAIRRLIASSGLAERIETQLEIDDLPVQPFHAAKIAIYRCAQECISNVLRHSKATALRIRLHLRGEALELWVEDNGHGFPENKPPSSGIGLAALREHAAALGGTCRISTSPAGVTVIVSFPIVDE